GNATTYTYNALGEQTAILLPTGGAVTDRYDPAGRLASSTNADGLRRNLTYDAAGQLAQEVWYAADGRTVTDTRSYTYDAAGHLLTAGNGAGSYTFTYDAAGRVVEVQEPFGLTLWFTYDLAGDRTRVLDSLGGE